MTVLIALPCAIVECEIVRRGSLADLLLTMNTSFRVKGIAARATVRGDVVVVKPT